MPRLLVTLRSVGFVARFGRRRVFTEKVSGVPASVEEVVSSFRLARERKQLRGRDHLRMLQTLVNLMKHTVDNHDKHPCTELRFVTILELLLSYQMEPWEPSSDVNSQWKRLGCKAEPGLDPEEFRRQAYQVLVSLPHHLVAFSQPVHTTKARPWRRGSPCPCVFRPGSRNSQNHSCEVTKFIRYFTISVAVSFSM
jgi:hypothetical protein